ncbi:MAG: ribosome maturation factor RimM [Chitinispirillia bacterium]
MNITNDSELIAIGSIGKPIGLFGWCRIFPIGKTLERCSLPLRVHAGKDNYYKTIVLSELYPYKKGYRGLFSQYNAKDSVDSLKNYQLYLERVHLPPKDDNEYYHFELEKMVVLCSDTKKYIGKVSAVYNYPTVDAIEIKKDDNLNIVVPLTKKIIKTVDLQNREIHIVASLIEDLL